MKKSYIKIIADALGVQPWQVENCILMLQDGNTIPFISRYRKEKTGGLDDLEVASVKHYAEDFEELDSRKETVLENIEAQGKLTDELRKAIEECTVSSVLEDLYLPYRPKRRTRASVAKEAGLEPLADKIWDLSCADPAREAKAFVGEKVESVDAALAGARDIIAEKFSETPAFRETLRGIFRRLHIKGSATKAADGNPDADKYKAWFRHSEPLQSIPSHRLLAMLRAEEEGFLSVKIDSDSEKCCKKLFYDFCQGKRYPNAAVSEQLKMALEDSFDRLLEPSISNEIIKEAKAKADKEAIRIFGENLQQLLLSAPVGQKRTLAIDPGFRNGCKMACLDENGRLLHDEIIFPHPPRSEKVASMMRISALVEQYGIQAIAIGNGTASRETEQFVKMTHLPSTCKVYVVSEDGASIYSASEVAREEFPDKDVTVRGAVSIGRRLMDPLSELVKIDPKSLGVGQYQYDVDQTALREKLDETVEHCVNLVGVNLNTASPYLLQYVSGIGPVLARNIVSYRDSEGAFPSRDALLKVPRLGAKAYQQCAGFLRVKGSSNPLDDSSVHPEAYPLVDKIAADLGVSTSTLVGNAELCSKIRPEAYVTEEFGLPTVTDVVKELAKPGLDPRESAAEFSFSEDIHSIEDLHEGMEIPGIVTNITAFGAFVDIGIHDQGLIHVSQFGLRVSSPSDVVKLHEHVKVLVSGVDLDRGRISLKYLSKL
ncbi:MAG: RNA-binding transcriptional accessory protein [Bacteroidales bacterium]|nr:RNA-binding transcriptional accessory protein [Bacteroidales bacterium]